MRCFLLNYKHYVSVTVNTLVKVEICDQTMDVSTFLLRYLRNVHEHQERGNSLSLYTSPHRTMLVRTVCTGWTHSVSGFKVMKIQIPLK